MGKNSNKMGGENCGRFVDDGGRGVFPRKLSSVI